MADQGSLVRVDMGGGNLTKLTRKQADDYVAAHPGAQVVGDKPVEAEANPDGEAEASPEKAKEVAREQPVRRAR